MHISRCLFGEKKFCVITFVFPNPSRPESFLLLGVGGGSIMWREVWFFCDRVWVRLSVFLFPLMPGFFARSDLSFSIKLCSILQARSDQFAPMPWTGKRCWSSEWSCSVAECQIKACVSYFFHFCFSYHSFVVFCCSFLDFLDPFLSDHPQPSNVAAPSFSWGRPHGWAWWSWQGRRGWGPFPVIFGMLDLPSTQ